MARQMGRSNGVIKGMQLLTNFETGKNDLVCLCISPNRVFGVYPPEVNACQRSAARLQVAPEMLVDSIRLRWLGCLLSRLRLLRFFEGVFIILHAVVDRVGIHRKKEKGYMWWCWVEKKGLL